VHNRLTSMQRADRTRSAGDDGAALEQIAAPALSPDELHEAEERTQWFARLVRALASDPGSADDGALERAFRALQCALVERLSDQQWILIRMRVLEGMRIVDCARALNVSVGTAHNWTRSALAICRVALEEAGVDAGPLCYGSADAGRRGDAR
jgi:DNA-directed RNA polymerase specialized sigma24 family protein